MFGVVFGTRDGTTLKAGAGVPVRPKPVVVATNFIISSAISSSLRNGEAGGMGVTGESLTGILRG